MRAQRARAAAQLALTPNAPAMGWTALGPAPLASDAGIGQDYNWVSGRATSVVIDPADGTGNTVYVGGAFGGLWRSTNAASGSSGNASGVTWTPLIDNQPTLAVGAIALQPVNATNNLSNVILVGTGEANSSGDSYYGLGILRSIDGGNNWSLISTANGGAYSFKGLSFSKIAFNSTTGNTNVVVAGVASTFAGEQEGADNLTVPRGVYYSADIGATWSLANLQGPGGTVTSASASAVVYNASAGKFYAAIRRHGFFSSTDGINWTRLANQPGGTLLSSTSCPENMNSTTCPIYRGEFAVVPGRNEMYVWFMDGHRRSESRYLAKQGRRQQLDTDQHNHYRCLRRSRLRRLRSPAG